ncbi:hypothetical protein D3C84_885800 [compost metagenome]
MARSDSGQAGEEMADDRTLPYSCPARPLNPDRRIGWRINVQRRPPSASVPLRDVGALHLLRNLCCANLRCGPQVEPAIEYIEIFIKRRLYRLYHTPADCRQFHAPDGSRVSRSARKADHRGASFRHCMLCRIICDYEAAPNLQNLITSSASRRNPPISA